MHRCGLRSLLDLTIIPRSSFAVNPSTLPTIVAALNAQAPIAEESPLTPKAFEKSSLGKQKLENNVDTTTRFWLQ